MMQRGRISLLIGALMVTCWFFFYSSAQSNGIGQMASHLKPSSGKSSSSSKNKMKIAILTMTTQSSTYQHLSLKNKWAYAKYHDYQLVVDYEVTEPKGPVWHKLTMMDEAIDSGWYDWVWWIDFDTLITNMTIKLEDIINDYTHMNPEPSKVDFLLTADCFPLNAGSMLVRSTPRSKIILEAVRKYGKEHPDLSEQDCLQKLIAENKNNEQAKVQMVPQWKMNAFPEENKCYDKDKKGWERGMFVVHFAGAWAYIKEDDPYGILMRKYEPFIIQPPRVGNMP